MREAQSAARSSGRRRAYSPHRISQQRTVVHAITVPAVVRPTRTRNTAANPWGVERRDSLTAVTHRTARAMHHTGQRPPTGHSARDPPGTGAGSDSGAGVAAGTAGTAGTRDRSSPPGVPGAVAA